MDKLFALSIIPFALALFSLVLKPCGLSRKLFSVGLWTHLVWAAVFVFAPLAENGRHILSLSDGFAVDRTAAVFVLLSIFVVACSMTQADLFFELEEEDSLQEDRSGQRGQSGQSQQSAHSGQSFRIKSFYACVAIFLLAMQAVFCSDNLAFLWIAIEATTLSSAVLVLYEHGKHAVEATWKYLIICSVGIAFALLGTVLIFASSQRADHLEGYLNISQLVANAQTLDFALLRLGFFFCLIGYGTKAGVFPMHSWLPDAHSEAPSPASAMLSGALLNCAVFGIWKVLSILMAASPGHAAAQVVTALGALSVLCASLFLIRQYSLKRIWAYSSLENVGLMLVAVGLGSSTLFLLQAINHSLSKVALFLLSGNITQAAGSKRLNKIHGVLKSCPLWATLTILAAFAVSGAPPFGAFFTETALLLRAAESAQSYLAAVIILSITIAFIAICFHLGRILVGEGSADFKLRYPLRSSLVPALLLSLSLLCGFLLNFETVDRLISQKTRTIPPNLQLNN